MPSFEEYNFWRDCAVVQIGNLRIMLHGSSYEKASAREMHSHPYYEMFFCKQGTVGLSSDTKSYVVQAGDLFCFLPKHYHSRYGQISRQQSAIRFTYRREKNGKYDVFTPFHALMTSADGVVIFGHIPEVQPIFEELEREATLEAPFGELRMQNLITRLVLELIRLKGRPIRDSGLRQNEEVRQRIFLVEEFFSENYMNPVTVCDLAHCLGLSEKQTNRTVKELYAVSFLQHLTERRIRVARELLRSTTLSVGVIAEKTGYASANSFYKAFRTATGMSPGTYRRQPLADDA